MQRIDELTFRAIAERWGDTSGKPPALVMGELVAAFWRGELEEQGRTVVFRLEKPISPPASDPPGRRAGSFAYSSMFADAVVNVGEDGISYPTADRQAGPKSVNSGFSKGSLRALWHSLRPLNSGPRTGKEFASSLVPKAC
jgi:hypothetical protein